MPGLPDMTHTGGVATLHPGISQPLQVKHHTAILRHVHRDAPGTDVIGNPATRYLLPHTATTQCIHTV